MTVTRRLDDRPWHVANHSEPRDLENEVRGICGMKLKRRKVSQAESFYRQLIALCGLDRQPGCPPPGDAEEVAVHATGEFVEVVIARREGEPFTARIRFRQEDAGAR